MKKGNVFGKSVFLLVVLFLTSLGVVSAEELTGWDEKRSEEESKLWEEKIESWDDLLDRWGKKREVCAFDTGVNDREYCNEKGCWLESMFEFEFKGKNGEEWKLWKDSLDSNVKGASDAWENINSGQVLEYSNTDGTVWHSDNRGQILDYKDSAGNEWESSNRGQVIRFKGINGNEWESSNHGQVLEYKENGVEWESSNHGQVEEYKDASGEEWSGSFDNKD